MAFQRHASLVSWGFDPLCEVVKHKTEVASMVTDVLFFFVASLGSKADAALQYFNLVVMAWYRVLFAHT